jgi:hypothetical protein
VGAEKYSAPCFHPLLVTLEALMIDRDILQMCFVPGTPITIKNWIGFTNRHHNEHRSPEETIRKFKNSEIAQYIDFNQLEKLMLPKPTTDTVTPISPITERTPMRVTLVLEEQQASELFNLLGKHIDEHPELHELMYQAMTRELFNSIGRG